MTRAAEAAASWVRARRATWTTPPATPAAPAPSVEAPEPVSEFEELEPLPEPIAASVELSAPPIPPPLLEQTGPSAAERIAEAIRSIPAPVIRAVALGALAIAVGTAGFMGIRAVWRSAPESPAKPPAAPATATPAQTPAARPAATGRRAPGSVRVTSTPAGARVLIDGKARGVTPLTLNDLSSGNHEVALESSAGTVRRAVTITSNETAVVEESIFSGWLAVFAPFEVAIAEKGRTLRPDERGQILLPPGLHELRVSNRNLGYEGTWSVEIKPGETTNLRVTPDASTLTVTAPEIAEVWVDGAKIGETPVNAVPIALGTHDVLVKHPNGPEKRYTVTVGVKPFTLNADFR